MTAQIQPLKLVHTERKTTAKATSLWKSSLLVNSSEDKRYKKVLLQDPATGVPPAASSLRRGGGVSSSSPDGDGGGYPIQVLTELGGGWYPHPSQDRGVPTSSPEGTPIWNWMGLPPTGIWMGYLPQSGTGWGDPSGRDL